MYNDLKVFAICAVDKNKGIGINNELPWPSLKDDFRWFKFKTKGLPVIMGSSTYQSIGRPLPGRENIVLSRKTSFLDTVRANTIPEALMLAEKYCKQNDKGEIAIIGGTSIYKGMEPYLDRIYLTEINHTFDVDSYFPVNLSDRIWDRELVVSFDEDTRNPYGFDIYEYIHKNTQR